MPVFLATYTSGKKFFSSYPFFPLYPNPAYFFFVLLVPDFPVFRPEFFKNNLFFAFWAHICFLKIEKHLKSLLSNLKIWILNSIYKDIQDIFYTMDLRAFIFWICFIIYFCFKNQVTCKFKLTEGWISARNTYWYPRKTMKLGIELKHANYE